MAGGFVRILICLLLLATPLVPQRRDDEEVKLPSGKSQREEILKMDHEKNLKDVVRIQELAQELEAQLKQSGHNVLSRSALQQVEDIEKAAKRIRGRLRRF